MRCFPILLVALASGACAGAINAPALGPESLPPARFSISIATDSTSAAHRVAAQELVDATLQVITSERFARNLAGLGKPYQRIWLSPFGETMSPAGIAQIYLGRHSTVRPVPIVIKIQEQDTPGQAFNDDSPSTSTIYLPPYVLNRRWRSNTLEQRSCAVNSLAHEIAHAFSQSPTDGVYIFADGGKGWFMSHFYGPLASYTIGTVAQCTMLEQADELSDGFAACLRRWGTKEFRSGACDRATA
jgi:hypothetical protein